MKTLNSPVLWVLVAILVTVAIILIVNSRTRSDWGFKDVVKDPKLWSEMGEARQAIDRAAEEAKQWNESQIVVAVNRFVFDIAGNQDGATEARVLESLGSRVHPAILQILSDVSQRTRLIKPTSTNLLPEAPFNRVCNLLGDTPPINIVPLITPFLDEPAKEIRQDAAFVLGKVGTLEVVAPLRKVFADSDEYVRSYGLMGLQWAMKNHRLDEQCARGLYEDIAQLIITGKNHDKSAGLLLDIDRTRATELFLSERVFAPNAPSLHEVLEALADRQIRVSRDRLLALIAELEKDEMKYPKTYALGESLRLLGQHKIADDRAFLEKRTGSSESRVAEGAAAGLVASFGLEGFEQRIWDAESAIGFFRLKPPQKSYLAVLMLDGEVNNGGLSQYFFNSSGGNWRDALAGLEAMGAAGQLAVFREAIAKFGKDGPSQDRALRQEQLAKLTRRDDALFDALDNRYYESKDSIEVLAKRYVLRNADAFK